MSFLTQTGRKLVTSLYGTRWFSTSLALDDLDPDSCNVLQQFQLPSIGAEYKYFLMKELCDLNDNHVGVNYNAMQYFASLRDKEGSLYCCNIVESQLSTLNENEVE